MANNAISVGKEGLDALEQLSETLEPRELWERIFTRLDQLASILAGRVIKDSLSGQLLKRRTGTLARSVVGRAVQVRGVPAIRVGIFRGPALAYAGIQESGGVIKPKNAKALAIPKESALTPAGVDRYGGPRNYPGELRFIPFRRGVAVGALVDEQEAKRADDSGEEWTLEDVLPVYLLVRQVTVPASNWLSKPMRENLPFVSRELANYFRSELTRGSQT